jgi:hypothetical protein
MSLLLASLLRGILYLEVPAGTECGRRGYSGAAGPLVLFPDDRQSLQDPGHHPPVEIVAEQNDEQVESPAVDLATVMEGFVQEAEMEKEDAGADEDDLPSIMAAGEELGEQKGDDHAPESAGQDGDEESQQVRRQRIVVGKDGLAGQIGEAVAGQPQPVKGFGAEKHDRGADDAGRSAFDEFLLFFEMVHALPPLSLII